MNQELYDFLYTLIDVIDDLEGPCDIEYPRANALLNTLANFELTEVKDQQIKGDTK